MLQPNSFLTEFSPMGAASRSYESGNAHSLVGITSAGSSCASTQGGMGFNRLRSRRNSTGTLAQITARFGIDRALPHIVPSDSPWTTPGCKHVCVWSFSLLGFTLHRRCPATRFSELLSDPGLMSAAVPTPLVVIRILRYGLQIFADRWNTIDAHSLVGMTSAGSFCASTQGGMG